MNINDIKRDVDFIRYKHELERQTADSTARRQTRRLIKAEVAEESKKLAEDVVVIEEVKLPSRPQLFRVVEHWVKVVTSMPHEICLYCNDPLLNRSDGLVDRVTCGHWVHSACLHPLMNTPPWNKDCQKCGKIISHKKYPIDEDNIGRRERAYTMELAKQSDFDEMFDIFKD